MSARLHIVGAGLSGATCAFYAKQSGVFEEIIIYDASPVAGGRIRTIANPAQTDNGTHLLIKGYSATLELARRLGSQDDFQPPNKKKYLFHDLDDNSKWSLHSEKIIRNIMLGTIKDFNFQDQKALFRTLMVHGKSAEALFSKNEKSYRSFWHPLLLGVFNTPLQDLPVFALRNLLFELIKRGPHALSPLLCQKTLRESLIDPALTDIHQRYGARLKAVEMKGNKVTCLHFRGNDSRQGPNDKVVLALPLSAYAHLETAFGLGKLWSSPISNIHFSVKTPQKDQLIALLGGLCQWIRLKDQIASVTISATSLSSTDQLDQINREVRHALGCQADDLSAPVKVVEKSATPYQNSFYFNQIKAFKSPAENLFFAGDWTMPPLPATIESAISSGKRAAIWAIAKKG